jgi:hypothetical protein
LVHAAPGSQIAPLHSRCDAEITLWWSSLSESVPRNIRKEINALVLLVARSIWLERNNRVFEKFTTIPAEVCRKIREEF